MLCFWIGIYPKPFLDFLHAADGAARRPPSSPGASTPRRHRRAHGTGAVHAAEPAGAQATCTARHAHQRAGGRARRRALTFVAPAPSRRGAPGYECREPMSPGEARVVPSWRVKVPLVACLVLVLLLAFLVFRFFLLTFTIAGSLALLMAPAQGTLSRRLGGRSARWRRPPALLVIAALLVPLLSYGTIIAQQATGFVDWLRPHLEPDEFDRSGARRSRRSSRWLDGLGAAGHRRHRHVDGLAPCATRHLAGQPLAQSFLAGAGHGRSRLRHLPDDAVLPAARRRRDPRGASAASRRSRAARSRGRRPPDAHGEGGAAVHDRSCPSPRALVASFGFWVFGVPSPLLWSLMVVFAALIPILGSPLGLGAGRALPPLPRGHGRALGLLALRRRS